MRFRGCCQNASRNSARAGPYSSRACRRSRGWSANNAARQRVKTPGVQAVVHHLQAVVSMPVAAGRLRRWRPPESAFVLHQAQPSVLLPFSALLDLRFHCVCPVLAVKDLIYVLFLFQLVGFWFSAVARAQGLASNGQSSGAGSTCLPKYASRSSLAQPSGCNPYTSLRPDCRPALRGLMNQPARNAFRQARRAGIFRCKLG